MVKLIGIILGICVWVLGVILIFNVIPKVIAHVVLYVVLPLLFIKLVHFIVRAIYHEFNPVAKQVYLERKEKESEDEW